MTHNLWVISYEYYFLEIFQTRPKSSTFSYSLSTIHGSSTPSWYAAPSSGNFNILLTRVFSNESRLNIDGTIMTETFFWLVRSFYGRKNIFWSTWRGLESNFDPLQNFALKISFWTILKLFDRSIWSSVKIFKKKFKMDQNEFFAADRAEIFNAKFCSGSKWLLALDSKAEILK